MSNDDRLKTTIVVLLIILQIVDKKTKISLNVLMFSSLFKKNKPYG